MGRVIYLLEFRFEYLVYLETPRALVHLYFLDNSGYGTLSHTQNGNFNIAMEVPMQEISINNTKKQ
jgi:hypothetical protein